MDFSRIPSVLTLSLVTTSKPSAASKRPNARDWGLAPELVLTGSRSRPRARSGTGDCTGSAPVQRVDISDDRNRPRPPSHCPGRRQQPGGWVSAISHIPTVQWRGGPPASGTRRLIRLASSAVGGSRPAPLRASAMDQAEECLSGCGQCAYKRRHAAALGCDAAPSPHLLLNNTGLCPHPFAHHSPAPFPFHRPTTLCSSPALHPPNRP